MTKAPAMQPIDFNGVDSAVNGPLRLGVLTALMLDGALDFTTLKKRLQASDGALAPHLRKLEETRYIQCKKQFSGRRPKSTYRITQQGRSALKADLENMQKVIDALK